MASDEFDDSEGGGLSKPKKVVAGAALGVAVPAAVAVAKKLIGSNGEDGDEASSEPMSRDRKQSSRKSGSSAKRATSSVRKPAKAAARTARKPAKAAATTTRKAANRTKEQLYKQATRLKIEGRSAMSKAELERAVNRAKQKVR